MDITRPEPVKIIEKIEDVAILNLPVPGFDHLTLNQKLLCYHLSQAAIIGDSITWNQNHKDGTKLRDFFFDLHKHEKELDKHFFEKLDLYVRKIIIHHGNHDTWTTTKFIPKFTKDELKKAIDVAKQQKHSVSEHDKHQFDMKHSFHHELDELFEKQVFDKHFESMITQKSPKDGDDIITASCNNFYQDLTLKDLENFEDKHPNNSTVVKENGKIVEKVWRAGNNHVPAGMFAQELKKMCEHIDEAIKVAPQNMHKPLMLMKKYFEEGDAKVCDEMNIAWAITHSDIDYIIGFIEEYRDTRGKKGFYEGLCLFTDYKTTDLVRKIASVSQELEEEAPWPAKYKKTWNTIPVANSINLLIGTGGGGPFCWAGVNLPNAQWIRQQHGSKSVILTNVSDAFKEAFSDISGKEFYEHEEDLKIAKKYKDINSIISVTLHEVVGHGSGKGSDKSEEDPRSVLKEYYSTLEEARAELCAIHHFHSETLMKIGVVPGEEFWKSRYLSWAHAGITQLKGIKEDELHEDHERARQLIVEYLRRKVGCIQFYKKNNKTYARVTDYELMKQGAAELLALIQEIKSEGKYDDAKELVEEYAVKFDKELRDEVNKRSEALNLPTNAAFVMPIPTLVKDAKGEIINVVLKYPKNVLDQATQWREIGF